MQFVDHSGSSLGFTVIRVARMAQGRLWLYHATFISKAVDLCGLNFYEQYVSLARSSDGIICAS